MGQNLFFCTVTYAARRSGDHWRSPDFRAALAVANHSSEERRPRMTSSTATATDVADQTGSLEGYLRVTCVGITPMQIAVVRSLFIEDRGETPISQIIAHLTTRKNEPLSVQTTTGELTIQRPNKHLTRNGEQLVPWPMLQEIMRNQHQVRTLVHRN